MKRKVRNSKARKNPLGQRQLTVIYYFDSRRTKSLRVSLPFLISAATLAIVLVLWTLISPFFIFEYRRQLSEKDRRVTDLLAKVFDYQTKYENVFEKAYPPSENVNQPALAEEGVPSPAGLDLSKQVKPTVPEKTSPTASSKEVSPGNLASAAATPDDKPAAKVAKAVDADTDADVSVNMENMVTTFTAEKLNATFALKNLANPAKTEGNIMGVAVFEKKDGGKVVVTNPPNQALKDDGSPQSLRKAVGFSIRYYKTKSLEFPRPQADGQFTSLTIYVSGKNDAAQKKFSYTLKDEKKEQPGAATSAPSGEEDKADEPEDGESGAAAPQSALQKEVGERADNGRTTQIDENLAKIPN